MKSKRIAVIGGGFAGMYCSLLLLDRFPTNTIYLFEAQDYLGGRNKMGLFENIPVSNGAGVIRERDVLLKELCRRFNIPIHPFVSKINYAFDTKGNSVKKYIQELKQHKKEWNRQESFSTNFKRLLGVKEYHHFISQCGYTDFQHADIYDTVYHYGFQDVTPNQKMYSVSWDDLTNALKEYMMTTGRFHLYLQHPIDDITGIYNYFDDVIWTGPRPTWDLLTNCFDNLEMEKWNQAINQVGCQPFLRAYAVPSSKQEQETAKKLFPTTTFFSFKNPLQKLMVITKKSKTIYMISYSDNENAIITDNQMKQKGLQQWLYQWTGIKWNITTLKKFPTSCGTHYFKPLHLQNKWKSRQSFLRFIQHPKKNLYLCSEGLSFNQGWTEGALESARNVIQVMSL